jgi:hypothetical protein
VERRIDVPDSPRRAIYVGWLVTVTRRNVEAQLEFFDWGIRLQRMHRKFIGDYYEIRFGELIQACQAGKMIRRGIRFYADVLPDPLTFVTVDYLEIFDQLERRGVPVNRDAERLMAMSWRRVIGRPGSAS